MHEFRQWFSGRGVVAGAVVALLVGAGLLFIGDGRDAAPEAPVAGRPAPAAPAPAPPRLREQVAEIGKAVTSPPPPLRIADIVGAVDAAAKAHAAGSGPVPENAALANRRFELRIPFGCGARGAEAGQPMPVEYDPKRERLTLSVRPQVWQGDPFAEAATEAAAIERVEGFWIPRPWLASEDCPARPAPDQADLPPPRQTVAVAQFFGTTASRLPQRGGKPYEIVKRVKPSEVEGPDGFRLVLRGRVVAQPDGRTVLCHSESPDYRPICLVSAEFDHVAFENPRNGDILAEWHF